ncbi:CDP-diacylglycerol--glycerol-3-phosphate 3-phosphatidyltransferase [Candidatus Deianiraea vastatrix]|uniref:CDP-diacylglycerol--glycerol-3-phosphate 3-phosphatidyltransferase n=1 Tax=Candidatus Deianiraea vastatrix TaxID=2163644 RepID=A0A5B8XDP8_9RICK|nr:CDP-diacylglycerol--glycerol-3-phosphate 3-phosphatidyltransferase [Candidatus Deianiraea vastatrix]QED23136.1 CDP-diacylglycerol--glycerol-3-phosphate 3-phosphatidyltransferase [Candidatus Deianiraea vastatrix]
MKKNDIPNYITISRFILIPVICFCIINPSLFSFAWLFFSIACISDFLDGYLARKFKAESEFGKCFDNIADKVLNICIIAILIWHRKIWLIPSLLVISREVLVPSFREYVALNSKQRLNVDMFGKVKTTFQFIALYVLIMPINDIHGFNLNYIGNLIFLFSAILSVLSCFMYIYKYLDRKNGK